MTVLIGFLKTHQIDPSTYIVNEFRGTFTWNYSANETIKNRLMKKMSQHSIFQERSNLYLITTDNQLITIDIVSGEIINHQNAFETLNQKLFWNPKSLERKYQKVEYPESYLLPDLQIGKTLAQGLAELLNKKLSDYKEDSAVIQIYVHTLLINKEGKCEDVSVSPTVRTDIHMDFDFKCNMELKAEIELWIKNQTFATNTIPKGFQKFKYSDFVYLK
ncbi:MAG: hypothetical protein KBF42_04790 [Chitinophagales bacterium]|nr:hypothetical protein [Bacteroidota bacterium]MBP8915558.1 hypothetical protein [Chitinophagales bacterium]MBP9220676.1 hypothetical protein [Chitinophagales bacterium]MBP9794678.1 hypothetical protein [Chitinophagales bacterium]